ncbi:hypothetical protein OEB99_15350 [Actinotalea sp. M2MS4P-6]|uniref:hypothetical protein n=1 Tax=Actinotalea sp. M2MS4P-6 TaxID=2983762 RepID=UPI0021E4270C|nr:hypothetical protein [Actinotalea sp. M2MS4P-6]MCV2395690.1 hypothetical protein [Actinotalea sp. M2MS4P-6]
MPDSAVRPVGTGTAFIAVPLVFVAAFAVHPDLLDPRLLTPGEVIDRAHGAALLQLGHALVLLATPLLVVVALHLVHVLDGTRAHRSGLAGGALAVIGALALAADKGALCLTMSAFDTLPEDVFAQLRPGVEALFDKAGWMVLVWGIVLLPLGFAIQAAALWRTGAVPRWQAASFLVGMLLIGTPDGMEIVNLAGAAALGVAFVPWGVGLIARGWAGRGGTSAVGPIGLPAVELAGVPQTR